MCEPNWSSDRMTRKDKMAHYWAKKSLCSLVLLLLVLVKGSTSLPLPSSSSSAEEEGGEISKTVNAMVRHAFWMCSIVPKILGVMTIRARGIIGIDLSKNG